MKIFKHQNNPSKNCSCINEHKCEFMVPERPNSSEVRILQIYKCAKSVAFGLSLTLHRLTMY